MVKRNGGTRLVYPSQNAPASPRSVEIGIDETDLSRGRTEEGYTKQMVENILFAEAGIRFNRDETAFVFDSAGNFLLQFDGKGASVTLGNNIPKNSIITHNHPTSIGKTGFRAIGNSFSQNDILTAVQLDAKEMRAVTPTYTFSIKRPEKGWNVSITNLKRALREADDQTFRKFNNYVYKMGHSAESIERATVLHAHNMMKIISKKYGWDYTKKKG